MKVLPLYLPHKGCTHQCVYCNQPLTVGVADDRHLWNSRLQSLDSSGHPDWEIAFYSGTFTALPYEFMDTCFQETAHAFSCSSVKGYRISTRPDRVSDSILDYLKNNGVTTIELGVESLDDHVLRKSARGHSSDDVRDACRRIQHKGFQLGMHLMCGLPGQNETSWQATVQETLAIKPDCVRIAPTIVLKDTPLAKLYDRGDYQPLSLEEAIVQSAYAYQRFRHHNISVIRVGLALSDEQGCGEEKIVAGPWHPALRHEVESRLAFHTITNSLPSLNQKKITIHPKDYSVVIGSKKHNQKKLSGLGYEVVIHTNESIPRHRFSINNKEIQPLFGVPKEDQ